MKLMSPPQTFQILPRKSSPRAQAMYVAVLLLAMCLSLSNEICFAQHAATPVAGLVMQSGPHQRLVTRPFLLADATMDDFSDVQWTGDLEIDAAGEYQLAVNVNGTVHVELDEAVRLQAQTSLLSWVEGRPFSAETGTHRLSITLRAAATSSTSPPQLNVFWRGPGFRWEPLPASRLSHKLPSNVDAPARGATGADAVRLLRCEACHSLNGHNPLPSPSLQQATQFTRNDWLLRFLDRDANPTSRWPWDSGLHNVHKKFSQQQARDLVAWMRSLAAESTTSKETPNALDGHSVGDIESGQKCFVGEGCLACHLHEGVGNAGPYGGGDLTELAQKRPREFVERWLAEPADINPSHRMPQFDLTAQEIADLAAFLMGNAKANASEAINGDETEGKRLAEEHSCLSCHRATTAIDTPSEPELSAASNWQQSCLHTNGKGRPGYELPDEQLAEDVRNYVTTLGSPLAIPPGKRLLVENNCLQCHNRGELGGLAIISADLADQHAGLGEVLQGIRPPALDSVGDKLHRTVMESVLAGKRQPIRTWLSVQMPRFDLSNHETKQLANYLIATDRVPNEAYAERVTDVRPPAGDRQAGERLVTSAGFGCTSCHAIGRSRPPASTPINQRAPNLSMPENRIRKVWFDRWVRDPARITPRMEMPSVQIPVKGICDTDLDRQLDAVWAALNSKGFSPPDAEPTRFVLLGRTSRPVVLTDVMKLNGRKLIKPFLVGLPNGHNILLDMRRARLAGWWTGIVAQQRTQGKTWYWEPGSLSAEEASDEPDLVLLRDGQPLVPTKSGQFHCEIQQWQTLEDGVELEYRVHFQVPGASEPLAVDIIQRISTAPQGWQRNVVVNGVPREFDVGLRAAEFTLQHDSPPKREGEFVVLDVSPNNARTVSLTYATDSDYAPPESSPELPVEKSVQRELSVMPGFEVTQLSLRRDIMPISLGWRPSGELVVGSLKGRVWSIKDTDANGMPDAASCISDDLAAPYGIFATDDYVDVVNKHSLIRLHDDDGDGHTDRHQVVAQGWGHTDDYHDWVVGLPRDQQGNYYLSIPCQQDDREMAAGKYRGRVLQLVPRTTGAYSIRELSKGHRFPMGIARNRDGQIFVTDNQGNYNPFNELNHVVPGRHFGFINRLERTAPPPATVTPPAISIPHPWTRSVNGICFLESNDERFGPFEGHLVGCEYDTRRLIRMSLDEVDGWVQGAAYPLAEAATNPADGLQGPINCGISPHGDLFIANIRDSGWGGGNNTGSIVRARLERHRLPAGIAEVSAIADGFRFTFTRPVDKKLAADPSNYSCASYRRISTPAYGGDDVDRRAEAVGPLRVSADGTWVEVLVPKLRAGYVYEWKLKSLVTDDGPFFPAEAYYSLQRLK